MNIKDKGKVKVNLRLCEFKYARRHEGVWRIGIIHPRILNLDT
jgi:hypothetical protein